MQHALALQALVDETGVLLVARTFAGIADLEAVAHLHSQVRHGLANLGLATDKDWRA